MVWGLEFLVLGLAQEMCDAGNLQVDLFCPRAQLVNLGFYPQP